jgi:hypothetical protein
VLVEGERITSQGRCWGAQLRSRVPLLFLGRRQYLMALTDRRVLVFEPRRRGPRATELVIGKRYETFTLERVRRRRLLMQVQLRAMNGNVMIFEFRPRQRELGGELIARLTPSKSGGPSHLMTALGAPAPTPAPMATGPIKGGSAAAASAVATASPPTFADLTDSSEDDDTVIDIPFDDTNEDADDGASDSAFWGEK